MQAFWLLFGGAAASTGIAALFTAGAPGQADLIRNYGLYAAAGAFVAGLSTKIIQEGKSMALFGKKDQEEIMKTGAASETSPEPAGETLPRKTALEALTALSGIKSLIESIQVTDVETWNALRRKTAEIAAGMEKFVELLGDLSRMAGSLQEDLKELGEMIPEEQG